MNTETGRYSCRQTDCRTLEKGERRKLREELQARCNLTELQAVNIINGFHIPDYVKIAAIKAEKEAQENEN